MLELISFIDQALKYHELIKVKFNDFKTEKKDLSQEIETQLQCPLVGMIGHVAIFYRSIPIPKKGRSPLPMISKRCVRKKVAKPVKLGQ